MTVNIPDSCSTERQDDVNMNRFYKKINVWFTLPAVALFIIVVLIPFFYGTGLLFLHHGEEHIFAGGSLSESFIGLDNYKKVFTNTKFLASLIYTVKFTVVAVLIINMAALALALLTNHILKGAGAFRTVFFFPIYWEDWHLDISGNLFLM